MRYSEAKWKKWYLDTTGNEWQDQAEAPDTSDWTPAQKKVGALLWERYVQDRQASEDLAYQQQQNRATALRAKRDAIAASDRLSRAFKETAQAKRIDGLGVADSVRSEQSARLTDALSGLEKGVRETNDKLLTNYLKERDIADYQTSVKQANLEQSIASEYQTAWKNLKGDIESELEGYRSRANSARYTEQGVARAKEIIEAHREELGDRYESAVQWADELPTYQTSKGAVVVTDYLGNQYEIAGWDYKLADIISYRGGAGAKVTSLDIFKVRDGDTTYTIKGGELADDGTDALLKAIAASKQMDLTVGQPIYYKGKLYVYDGVAGFRTTRVAYTESASDGLRKLLARLQTKTYMAREELS